MAPEGGLARPRPRVRQRRGYERTKARRPVSRVLSPPGPEPGQGMAIHLGRPSPGASCDLPGRRRGNPPGREACRPYLVLLPVGFAVPSPLPATRCALTAPFHPYPWASAEARRRFAFCGTFPRVAPAGRYPAPCSRGARTFLPPAAFAIAGRRPSGRLAPFYLRISMPSVNRQARAARRAGPSSRGRVRRRGAPAVCSLWHFP